MRLALAEARRGRGAVEPNPMVGAVVVRDGRLVALGHHARFGGPHAEVEALARAGEEARGSTLYVTLEPCCHHGKTPPCTDAVLAAGVARVVAAMEDPFPQVGGRGLARLREAGIDVAVGVGEREARRLNAPYLKLLSTGRPFVIAKWAMTLDGKTACASGDSRWITGERSRALVHEERGVMDAIVVGIGTALADDPELTARLAGPRRALRVVVDRLARLPLTSRLVRTAREVPVMVATTDGAPSDRRTGLEAAGCAVLVMPGGDAVSIPDLLDELGRRRMTNVLVEGGGTLLGAFLDTGEVDAVDVFIAPIVEGGPPAFVPARGRGFEAMARAPRLVDPETMLIEGDVRVRGLVPRPWHGVARLDRSADLPEDY
jgi:diaminohydroxyphosphoribosylaminopyrimidine deaminase/5-amino-6-(5-phosphoribosylamino)uracil reductase